MEGDIFKGRVIWFSRVKGYGFIQSDALACDVFVHARDVSGRKDLLPEQEVEFGLGKTKLGSWVAVNVEVRRA